MWPCSCVTLATSTQVTPSSAATASTLTASLPVGRPVVPGWSPDCVVPCRVVLVLAVVLVLSAGELRRRHPAPPCPGASSHRRVPPHRRPPPRRHSHVGCRLTSRHRRAAGLCRVAGHVHAAGQLHATDHHFAAGHDSTRRPQGSTVPPASAVPPATTLPPAIMLLPAAATCRCVTPSCRRPRRLPSAADHYRTAGRHRAASKHRAAGQKPAAGPHQAAGHHRADGHHPPPVITFSSASGSPSATLSTSVVSATSPIFPWALSAPLAAPTK